MRVTIVVSSRLVAVNGVAYDELDLSCCGIPQNVHALQWYADYGEIEFTRGLSGSAFIHPPNEVVDVLPAWAISALQVYEQAAAEQAAAEQAAAELPTGYKE